MKLKFYEPATVNDVAISQDAPQEFKSLYEIARRLEEIVEGMDEEISIVGEEGLGSFLRKTVFSFVNILGHVLNTFKTNIFKFYKDLKRSELKYYHESNMASVNFVLRSDYNKMVEMEIDFPDKMSASYLETATTIDKFLQTLDMPIRIKAIYKHTEKAISDIMRTPENGSQLGTSITQMEFNLPELAKQFTTVSNCFREPKHVKKKSFRKLFKRPSDLKETDTLLLKGERHLQGVAKVYDDIEATEKQFEKLLDAVDGKKIVSIDKPSMKVLAAYCAAIARLCDMYGTTMHDFQRVEHNFVMVLKDLRKKLEA